MIKNERITISYMREKKCKNFRYAKKQEDETHNQKKSQLE